MPQPISFAHRNLVFGEGAHDAWALYRLDMLPYAGLPEGARLEAQRRLADVAEALAADFSLLRVARPWSIEDYVIGVEAASDVRHTQRDALTRHLRAQRKRLAGRPAHTGEVYLSVRLPRERRLWLRPRSAETAISARRLAELEAAAERIPGQIEHLVGCTAASEDELQWLIRRAYCRGLGDPAVDRHFKPQALAVDGYGASYRPLEVDLWRLFDSPISVGTRSLRVESELGTSHQALLCLGALPGQADFPADQAELLFAPLEAVDFPVDAAFTARRASDGPARLLGGGTADVRGPLLAASISLCVSATSEDQLEQRVERLRRAYRPVHLHRPLGDQLDLFATHLPAQAGRVRGYERYLTASEFGALVPLAPDAVGASRGPCVGHTLTATPRPVRFDCRPPRIALLTGQRGSGKTVALELIAYQAFLTGSTVCAVEPTGGQALARLPGLAERASVHELSPADSTDGRLDPLHVAPPEMRECVAGDFLLGLLPEHLATGCRPAIRQAVERAMRAPGAGCVDVVTELARGPARAREAARVLEAAARTWPARLGFAVPGTVATNGHSEDCTLLRIDRPEPAAPGATGDIDRRGWTAVQRLLAVHAFELAGRDPQRHAVLTLDDASALVSDAAGRALIRELDRRGRERNVTTLVATRTAGGADELRGLAADTFAFAARDERDATQALRLLGLDHGDRQLRQTLASFPRGRCLMRDHNGRTGPVRIEVFDPELQRVFDAARPVSRRL